MQRRIDQLLEYPRAVVAVVTLLCLAAVSAVAVRAVDQGGLLTVDATFEALLPADSGHTQAMQRLEARFGDPNPLLFAIMLDELFSVEGLQAVAEVHALLEAADGVDAVASLAATPNLLFDAGEAVDVGSVTDQFQRNPAALTAIADSAKRNPLINSALFNAETHTAAFIVSLEQHDPARQRDQAMQLLEQIRGVNAVRDAAVTGNAIIQAATTEAIWSGLSRTMPVALALVVLMLALAFRSVLVILLGSMSIGVSLLIMWATGAVLGYSLNMVTAIAPPVVVAFGIMFSIHMVSEWLRHAVGENPKRARSAVGAIAVPILLNGLTTSLGLAALLLSPLPAVREFAVLSVTGVAALTLLSLSYLPALLLLMGSRISLAPPPGEAFAIRAGRRLAWFDVRWRRVIVAVAALIALLGFWGAQKVEPGTAYVENFSENAPVRQQFDRINGALGGAAGMAILLETPLDHALLDPDIAEAVDALAVWLREQPEVGAAVSYVDHIKILDTSMRERYDAPLRYPDSARLARQLMMFSGNDSVAHLIDGRNRTAQIVVRINVDHSARISDLIARIESRAMALPMAVTATVTGTPVLAARTVGSIVERQWLSVAAALVAIFLVLCMLFLSTRAALVAMLPNLLPVAVYFGLLGVTGIGLNPATSMIACLVIGVAVDDTIHFLARFNSEARRRGSEGAAVSHALGSILRPVTLTTAALCLSFGAFAFSPLQSQAQFGLLAAFALFIAWATDLLLLPALGSMVRIVTLWDLLRVDLGRSPQYTVPLLAGLSNRQARIFALTARYDDVPAGTDIMREGETSNEICVCIEGQLEVWVLRDGQRKVLNTLFRGATLGEAGYFGQKRTATVTTRNKARLLRFNAHDLERLRRRHPRIAALVLRNLNRIQAERLAHATAMLR